MSLILASQSPRRRELLGLFHIPFTVCAADIDESMDPEKSPREEVARVSRAKALAIPRLPGDVVVAADTIVVCDGRVLGKPRDEADAVRMLTMLSGREHQVMTGLTVLNDQQAVTCTEVTEIQFRALSPEEIEKTLRCPLAGVIPDDDNVFLRNAGAIPSDSPSFKAFKILAANVGSGKSKIYDYVSKYSGFWGAIRRGIKRNI